MMLSYPTFCFSIRALLLAALNPWAPQHSKFNKALMSPTANARHLKKTRPNLQCYWKLAGAWWSFLTRFVHWNFSLFFWTIFLPSSDKRIDEIQKNWSNPNELMQSKIYSSLPHHKKNPTSKGFSCNLLELLFISILSSHSYGLLSKKNSLSEITSLFLVPLLPHNAPDFAAWFPKQRQGMIRWLWHPRLKQQLDFDPPIAVNESFSTERVQASLLSSNNNFFTALCIIFPSEKTFVHGDDSCCSWGQWQTSHSLQWCKGWVAVVQSTLEHHTMRLYFL